MDNSLDLKNKIIKKLDSNKALDIVAIDLVVHIFNPEKRKFYELEKMWSELIPRERVMIWENYQLYFFYSYIF